MENKYIIYTDIHHNGSIQRWFYGIYNNRDVANAEAQRMNEEYNLPSQGIYRCVCKAEDAGKMGVMNMPK